MPVNVPLVAFNRGIISKLALARTDIARVAQSAQEMTNWMPRVLGPMALRPGLGFLGHVFGDDRQARYIPFVFSTGDTALLELTDSIMRVWIDDEVASWPAAVTTTITNGGFVGDLTGWTDADEAGATSQWAFGNHMQLTGTGFSKAVRYQLVTVPAADVNVEHGLEVAIHRGPVTIRIGSTLGGDEYITETDLETGNHLLSVTPGGDFYIQFQNRLARSVFVGFLVFQGFTFPSGALYLRVDTPWSPSDFANLRFDQSADVIFVADGRQQQRRIERRGSYSWSVVLYNAPDGPFLDENLTTITVTPSALTGNITLTASDKIFRDTHVGSVWKIRSVGQIVTATITGDEQFTDPIKITGVGDQRVFHVVRSGTWTATVTLQRSLEEPGTWVDVSTSTVNQPGNDLSDELDNQIVWYRMGVKTGDFGSGIMVVTLSTTSGSIGGTVRITDFTSATQVEAEVLKSLGGTSPTTLWSEGQWSDFRGWPSAVALHEGRLWWAGKNKIAGSVSDAYDNFDIDTIGDSGPVLRSIGSGPVDTINWLMSLQRLVVGGQGAEYSARTSSFDEPLTPTAFALRSGSTQGSAGVDAVKLDDLAIFVHRNGKKLYQLSFNSDSYEYTSTDLTLLAPSIGSPGIVRLAVQRQPDTRIHCVRSDGTVAVLVFDEAEKVRAWCEVETDGFIEDAVVLPDLDEDAVYYFVNRTINGSTMRGLERWALTDECNGGTLNKQADAFIVYSGASTTTITGLTHLEGETVVVWGDGKDLGDYTVTGGQVTGLSQSVTNAVVGLPYEANWQSTKLAYGAQMGSALTQPKRIPRLGLILTDTHAQGLQFGPDASHLDNLPLMEDFALVGDDAIHAVYDEQSITFPGTWDTDSRLWLRATAPRPCTALAAIIDVDTHDKR